jgi:hypothetical protein
MLQESYPMELLPDCTNFTSGAEAFPPRLHMCCSVVLPSDEGK